jgi:hypothetical protein
MGSHLVQQRLTDVHSLKAEKKEALRQANVVAGSELSIFRQLMMYDP